MTKEGSIKIINLMTCDVRCSGSYARAKQVIIVNMHNDPTLSIYSTLIAIVDFYSFYIGAVDMQIYALLTRSQCSL